MAILKQEEYKGYIISIGIFHMSDHLGYKILVNKPFWINLRTKSLGAKTEEELIVRAKAYIDEYGDRLKQQIASKIMKKTGAKRTNYINYGANLPDGDQWSDYAATESDY